MKIDWAKLFVYGVIACFVILFWYFIFGIVFGL